MRKCNVCGRLFRILAKNRYEVVEKAVGFEQLVTPIVYHNAFDCPYCGCQNRIGTFLKKQQDEQVGNPDRSEREVGEQE